jgi:hypothetical protein
VHPDQIQNGNCQSLAHVVLDNSSGASDAEERGITAGQTLAAIKMTLALLPAEARRMKFAYLLQMSLWKSALPCGA